MKEKKIRIRRKNFGFKKLIFWIICIILIVLIVRMIIPATTTFSKYVYSVVRNYYLNAKKFYFNSDKLKEENVAKFETDNWSGVERYEIGVSLNSRKNNLEAADTDIDYNVYAKYKIYKSNGNMHDNQELITMSFPPRKNVPQVMVPKFGDFYYKFNGVLKVSLQNRENFKIELKPNIVQGTKKLETGDYILVDIIAEATKPYEKVLKGQFKIVVGELGMTYVIEDKPYQPYCEVRVTNTLDYYTVDKDFKAYKVGDKIPISDYILLSEEERKNCHSMTINMDFNPEDVVIDTTSGIYIDANKKGNITNIDKNGYNYVNSLKFNMDAEESKVVKFYKNDPSKDYTYPFTSSSTGSGKVVNVTFK